MADIREIVNEFSIENCFIVPCLFNAKESLDYFKISQ